MKNIFFLTYNSRIAVDLFRAGGTGDIQPEIGNLVNLAPDIQEALLFLPRTEQSRDPIHLRLIQPIATALDWKKQRRLWKELVAGSKSLTEIDSVS